jgi:hypothetical protein
MVYSCPPVRSAQIHLGATVEEKFGVVVVPLGNSLHVRCEAVVGIVVDVRTGAKELARRLDVAACDGVEELLGARLDIAAGAGRHARRLRHLSLLGSCRVRGFTR